MNMPLTPKHPKVTGIAMRTQEQLRVRLISFFHSLFCMGRLPKTTHESLTWPPGDSHREILWIYPGQQQVHQSLSDHDHLENNILKHNSLEG